MYSGFNHKANLKILLLDRYRCIVNTFAARLSKSVLRYLVALIWSVALVPAFPLLGVNKLTEKSPIYCEENWPKPQYRTVYNTVSFALTYVIPLGIMSLLYIKIAIALNKVVKEGGNREGFTNQKKKDKVLRMLLALVIAYATCFLPTHVLVLWDEYGDGGKNRSVEWEKFPTPYKKRPLSFERFRFLQLISGHVSKRSFQVCFDYS